MKLLLKVQKAINKAAELHKGQTRKEEGNQIKILR